MAIGVLCSRIDHIERIYRQRLTSKTNGAEAPFQIGNVNSAIRVTCWGLRNVAIQIVVEPARGQHEATVVLLSVIQAALLKCESFRALCGQSQQTSGNAARTTQNASWYGALSDWRKGKGIIFRRLGDNTVVPCGVCLIDSSKVQWKAAIWKETCEEGE